jgi:hypothetical protein
MATNEWDRWSVSEIERINLTEFRNFWQNFIMLKISKMAAYKWKRWSVSERINLTEFRNFWQNFIMLKIFEDGR